MVLKRPASRPSTGWRPLRRFRRADDGATAVEFALIALPFFVLLFGIIELSMIFMTSAVLETASEAAARQIRTGAFQQSSASGKDDFKALVCQGMLWMQSSCDTDLYVDVRTFSSFATLAANPPANSDGFNPSATCFTAGAPGDIVLVRTYYKWRLITPLLNVALENMGDGSGERLLNATTAFRNEPYSDGDALGAKC